MRRMCPSWAATWEKKYGVATLGVASDFIQNRATPGHSSCQCRSRRRLLPSRSFSRGLLSTALRRELRFDMLGRLMVILPAFNLWNTCDITIIKDICFEAATFKHLASNDSLFHESTDAKGAFLVVSGKLLYVRNPDMSIVETFEEQIVEQDTWLCEAALWTYWVHTGACEAKSISQVVLIQATLLAAVVWRHRHIRARTCCCVRVRLSQETLGGLLPRVGHH